MLLNACDGQKHADCDADGVLTAADFCFRSSSSADTYADATPTRRHIAEPLLPLKYVAGVHEGNGNEQLAPAGQHRNAAWID